MKRYLVVVMFLVLASFSYGYVAQISSFQGEDNPINYTFGIEENLSYFLRLPYANITNFTLTYDSSIPEICTQGIADQATDCGGLDTGGYFYTPGNYSNPGNLIDNDWTTFARPGINTTFFVNYTIPTWIESANWSVGTFNGAKNLVVNDTCLEGTELQIRAVFILSTNWYYFDCYNSSGEWTNLSNEDAGLRDFYEDNVTWVFRSFEQEVNETMLNDALNGGCECDVCESRGTLCDYYFYTDTSNTTLTINLTNLTYEYGIDNCSIYTDDTINATFRNEDGTLIPLDYEYSFNYGIFNLTEDNYSSFANNYDNFGLCIYPSWAKINITGIIAYGNQSYAVDNLELTNDTKLLNLTHRSGTTDVTFSVLDTTSQIVEGAYIHILEWDISTNSYSTTEILKTDSSGEAVGKIKIGTAFYRFIINYKGETKLIDPETQGVKIYGTTRTFRISTEQIEWWENADVTYGVTTDLTYNDDTDSFVFTWSDSSGEMHQGCLRVTQSNQSGSSTLFDQCVVSTSSSIVAPITPSNNTRYIGQGYLKFDDEFLVETFEKFFQYDFSFKELKDGKEPIFFAWMFIAGIALIGTFNPAISFILMIAALIGSVALQLFTISWSLVGAITVLGFAHLYIASKR